MGTIQRRCGICVKGSKASSICSTIRSMPPAPIAELRHQSEQYELRILAIRDKSKNN